MRKVVITLLLLLCVTAFAKTWDAKLKFCYEITGGFWFPDHKWTDKGEPWIKSLMYGEQIYDYGEYGLSFDFEYVGYCFTCDWENPFNLFFTGGKEQRLSIKDSVYFFRDCKNELLLENLSIDDFDLVTNIVGWDYTPQNNNSYFSLGGYYWNCDEYEYEKGIYFIYKKHSDRFEYNALCHFIMDFGYGIQCVFQDDGTLNFDKVPKADPLPEPWVVPEDYCAAFSSQKVPQRRQPLKNFFANQPFYKINGTPASQGSSNIIIKNNQPTLQLKGER